MSGGAKLYPVLSWRGAITNSDLSSTTKHIALALSLYMSDVGGSAFPGAVRLASDTGLSERCVRTHLGLLLGGGWLAVVKGGRRGGRNCANVYQAHIPETINPAPETVNQMQGLPRNPASDDTKTLHHVHPISPKNSPKPRGRSSTPMPDKFHVTRDLEKWAAKTGVTVDLSRETDQWADYHRAKGTLAKDWVASWRTWMRNSIKFERGRTRPGPDLDDVGALTDPSLWPS